MFYILFLTPFFPFAGCVTFLFVCLCFLHPIIWLFSLHHPLFSGFFLLHFLSELNLLLHVFSPRSLNTCSHSHIQAVCGYSHTMSVPMLLLGLFCFLIKLFELQHFWTTSCSLKGALASRQHLPHLSVLPTPEQIHPT